MGRRFAPLELDEVERAELTALASRRSTAQALALRARIILACADGEQSKVVAARLAVDPDTVGKWRRRFSEHRLEGLWDEPRSGTPRTIEDARIEAVIVRTLETQPPDATHWSSRGMARASGLSVSTVQRIWRAFGLQPHRLETFKLSTDPDFVAKVRDVVGLYVAPPERAIVLCLVAHRLRVDRRLFLAQPSQHRARQSAIGSRQCLHQPPLHRCNRWPSSLRRIQDERRWHQSRWRRLFAEFPSPARRDRKRCTPRDGSGKNARIPGRISLAKEVAHERRAAGKRSKKTATDPGDGPCSTASPL